MGVTNVRIGIIYHPILSVCLKNLDVFTKMVNAPIVIIHSNLMILHKNVELKDATKLTILDVLNVSTHSRKKMLASVLSLIVSPCRTIGVLDVHPATILSRDSPVLKMIHLALNIIKMEIAKLVIKDICSWPQANVKLLRIIVFK